MLFWLFFILYFSEIVEKNKKKLEDVVGTYIVEIDGDFYSIPPNATLNEIMIPIAFLMLLIVVLMAVGCYCFK